jgi:hypothetical protein
VELLTIVHNVLQATNIQSEAVTVLTHEFELCDFMQDIRSQYRERAGGDVKMQWDIPAMLPAVKTDQEKLKAILKNLLNNAIKFTEKGHVIVSIRQSPYSNMLQFKITDTGVGIPTETIPFIFKMFEQGDSSATRRHGGLGLGLYVSKHFAELLGGKIEVESHIEHGSTFTVNLPIAVEASLPRLLGSIAS